MVFVQAGMWINTNIITQRLVMLDQIDNITFKAFFILAIAALAL
jgi:hypothetical protein